MIGYLISTNINYTAPLFRLLSSMGTAGIDPDRIVVVSGGHAAEARRMWHNPIVEVLHNSYDYTALIDYVAHPMQYPAWSHIFLLQDTMELGPDADRLIAQAPRHLDAVSAGGAECNLGLYRADYLRSRARDILALTNCSKLRSVEAEGFLWRELPDHRRGEYAGAIQVDGPHAIYSGAPRQRIYYAGLDLTKYKANWGQTWPPAVVTP